MRLTQGVTERFEGTKQLDGFPFLKGVVRRGEWVPAVWRPTQGADRAAKPLRSFESDSKNGVANAARLLERTTDDAPQNRPARPADVQIKQTVPGPALKINKSRLGVARAMSWTCGH